MTRLQKIRLGALAIAAMAVLWAWTATHSQQHRIRLAACFNDVRGLKAGAMVRISGVDVGYTKSVEAHPERKDCLAEVRMSLATPYELAVPSDAVARIESDGLLGPEFVQIDVRGASAPPAADNGRLKTAPTIAPLQAIKALVNAATVQSAECASKQKKSPPSTKP